MRQGLVRRHGRSFSAERPYQFGSLPAVSSSLIRNRVKITYEGKPPLEFSLEIPVPFCRLGSVSALLYAIM